MGIPPVIMMAGVGGWRGQWAPAANRLRALGQEAFVVPAPHAGFGSLEDDIAAMRDAITSVRALTGSPVVRLAGHSKGGITAVEAARREPVGTVDRVVTVASPHNGVGPAWASDAVDDLPLPQVLQDLAQGSPALRGQVADGAFDIVSIHHATTDGMVSARAATIHGPRGTNVTYEGGGWRASHGFNVSHNPQVLDAIQQALTVPVAPARAITAA